MAARNMTHPRTIQREMVILAGKGVGAGANPLTGLVFPGVTSITHLGSTGKYRVTLDDKYDALLACTGNVEDLTAPDDWSVTIDSDTVSSKIIDISTWKGGLLADLTTDEKLHLIIALRNSKQTWG